MDEKTYMDFCMAYYKQCVMVCQILHQGHFQEVGLIQILAYYVHGTAFG